MSNRTIQFTLTLPNVIHCDKYGNGSKTFTEEDLAIPSGTIQGNPSNLFQLSSMIGSEHLSINYYAKPSGSVSYHDCGANYVLYAQGELTQGQLTSMVELFSTDRQPYGGSISMEKIPLATDSKNIITSLKSFEKCYCGFFCGCGCRFESFGGWSSASIDLIIEVSADLFAYCTTGDNIHNDMCFSYISDYIKSNPFKQKEVDIYMSDYCKRKFPNQGLSIFNQPIKIDKRDYEICACNMPEEDYRQFETSLKKQFPELNLGIIKPNCLLPACNLSSFKPSNLDNCPVPQCLSIINVTDNNIAGPAVINSSINCSQYGITGGSGPVTPSPEPSPEEETFLQKYRFYIIGILVIVLIIILIIAVVFIVKRKKGK
jgi:hypothetical protein